MIVFSLVLPLAALFIGTVALSIAVATFLEVKRQKTQMGYAFKRLGDMEEEAKSLIDRLQLVERGNEGFQITLNEWEGRMYDLTAKWADEGMAYLSRRNRQ